MSESDDTRKLRAMLQEEYDNLSENDDVDTGILAKLVYERIDSDRAAPALVAHAAKLELKQLARSVCRKIHAEEEDLAENGNLFDFKLQLRYPAAHEGENIDLYRTINHMEQKDFEYNISRLEKEAEAKKMHANALRAEMEARIRKGMLVSA